MGGMTEMLFEGVLCDFCEEDLDEEKARAGTRTQENISKRSIPKMKVKLNEKYYIEVSKSYFCLRTYDNPQKIITMAYNMEQALNSAANHFLMEEVGDGFITLSEYQYRLQDIKDDLIQGVYSYGG